MLHFSEYAEGELFTISVTVRFTDVQHTATLTDRLRRPLIDALLWWALGRTLDHLVATAYNAILLRQGDVHEAYTEAEALHDLYFRTPYTESDDERATRITRYFMEHLPRLAPLCELAPPLKAVYAQAEAIARILHERVEHSYATPLHGVADVYHVAREAA